MLKLKKLRLVVISCLFAAFVFCFKPNKCFSAGEEILTCHQVLCEAIAHESIDYLRLLRMHGELSIYIRDVCVQLSRFLTFESIIYYTKGHGGNIPKAWVQYFHPGTYPHPIFDPSNSGMQMALKEWVRFSRDEVLRRFFDDALDGNLGKWEHMLTTVKNNMGPLYDRDNYMRELEVYFETYLYYARSGSFTQSSCA